MFIRAEEWLSGVQSGQEVRVPGQRRSTLVSTCKD
jgi:hypothetical protein